MPGVFDEDKLRVPDLTGEKIHAVGRKNAIQTALKDQRLASNLSQAVDHILIAELGFDDTLARRVIAVPSLAIRGNDFRRAIFVRNPVPMSDDSCGVLGIGYSAILGAQSGGALDDHLAGFVA